MKLHAKFGSPRLYDHVHGDFLSFIYIGPCKNYDVNSGVKFDRKSYNLCTLGRGLRDKATCKIW